ncbi:hypothetical protein J41TS12_17260 [Paenibacillus antibioticophila]|uniref:Uncharacterized protein n=1 Tax=Paenibacillus antibioticophila TaxID=1274374 RepID=A0A920CER0_9BACL|nr:hypothetical protein [Paenibacillus antibioticophila]GIO36865.1 hypothetical protein J41TS12_17260 [Paenibacillus antibioticophila]
MYTYIDKAINDRVQLTLQLDDGSQLVGMPSWPKDRSRVNIKAHGGAAWIPLADIRHVTT